MKRRSFALVSITLLMAALCLTARAQTWEFAAKWSPWGLPVNSVAFAGNHTVFFTQNYEDWDQYDLWKWDLAAQETQRKDVGTWISEIDIPEDDPSFVVYAKTDGNVGMRYTSNLSWRGGFSTSPDGGAKLAVSANGKRLVTYPWGPSKVTIVTWDISNPEAKNEGTISINDRTHINDLELDTAGGYIFVADGDGNTDERHFGSGNISHVYDSGQEVREVAYQGGYIASAYYEYRPAVGKSFYGVHIWGYNPPRFIRTLSAPSFDIPRAVIFSKDRQYVAVGELGSRLLVWKVSDGTLLVDDDKIKQEPGVTGIINDVAFSADGNYIAVATGMGPDYDEEARGAYLYIWRRSSAAAPTATPPIETPILETTLFANYPNPFNPETWIPYQLAKPAEVTVTIHAADGKLVRTLKLGQLPAGVYESKRRAAYWDGKNDQGEAVASGVYFYTLKARDFSATKKMLIMK